MGWAEHHKILHSQVMGWAVLKSYFSLFSLFQADLFLLWAPVMGHLNSKFVHGLIKFVYGLMHLIS